MIHQHEENKEFIRKNVMEPFADHAGCSSFELTELLYNRFPVESYAFADDYKFHTIIGYFQQKVIPHKIHVYDAGMEMVSRGIPEGFGIRDEDFIQNLWIHDLSKFSAWESEAYAFHDFTSNAVDPLFQKAWHHHKTNNLHHPEYWLSISREGIITPLDMPMIYVLEMVADWQGAGMTYGKSLEEWIPFNLHKFFWSKRTAYDVMNALFAVGISTLR